MTNARYDELKTLKNDSGWNEDALAKYYNNDPNNNNGYGAGALQNFNSWRAGY